MDIDNKKIDLFYELIDKACMIYYNDISLDYLESFIKVSEDITNSFNDSKLSESAIKKLNKIYDTISETDFLSEEVRLGAELIIIKGLKHRNILLDFLTPDTINYIFSYIINAIISYNKKYVDCENITILDTVLGTSNLLQAIINNCSIKCNGIGIDNDELLVHVAKAFANLLENELIINYQNASDANSSLCDICIGDFGESKDIYKIIIERLNNISDDGYFIYLINNDFFRGCDRDFHHNLSSQATLIGLVSLPNCFVSENHIGKSILIGKKAILTDYQMGVITIDNDLNSENMQKSLDKIRFMMKKIGG